MIIRIMALTITLLLPSYSGFADDETCSTLRKLVRYSNDAFADIRGNEDPEDIFISTLTLPGVEDSEYCTIGVAGRNSSFRCTWYALGAGHGAQLTEFADDIRSCFPGAEEDADQERGDYRFYMVDSLGRITIQVHRVGKGGIEFILKRRKRS